MSVNSTHPDYGASLPAWLRARDVIAGEDAMKSAGEKFLPRLEAQTDEEYSAYRARASLFNATARTADGYLGLLFRWPLFIKVPEDTNALGKAMRAFVNDARIPKKETRVQTGVFAVLYVSSLLLFSRRSAGSDRRNKQQCPRSDDEVRASSCLHFKCG
jgi:hypothetical protein